MIRAKYSLVGKLNNAVVKLNPELEDLKVTPSSEEQTFKSSKYGYNNVTVEAISEEYIKPEGTLEVTENGKYDVKEKSEVNVKVGLDYFVEEPNATSNKMVYKIKKMPTVDISTNNSLANAFEYFQSLEEAPWLETSHITNMNYMFRNCQKLKTIPKYDTSNVTNMSGMFLTCIELETIPEFDTSSVTDLSSFISSCSKIKSLPKLNVSKVTKMAGMCENSISLEEIPDWDFSTVESLQSAFRGCTSLTSVPDIYAPLNKAVRQLFWNDKNLIEIGEINCESVQFVDDALYNVAYGRENEFKFGGFKDIGKAYTTDKSANYSYYHVVVPHTNAKITVPHETLMNVINKLYDIASLGVQTQKLNIGSSNVATLTADEIAIATNKGWTVV